MDQKPAPVDCYIGSFYRPLQEPWLDAQGFGRGMIMFAIPSHGILFKCRAEGNLIDLEFGAFFALLRFIHTSLAAEKIKAVRVHSSLSEFIFAVVNEGPQVRSRRRRHKMLQDNLVRFDLELVYVPAARNRTRTAPADFPSTPKDQTPPLRPRYGDRPKVRFRPIQKGILL